MQDNKGNETKPTVKAERKPVTKDLELTRPINLIVQKINQMNYPMNDINAHQLKPALGPPQTCQYHQLPKEKSITNRENPTRLNFLTGQTHSQLTPLVPYGSQRGCCFPPPLEHLPFQPLYGWDSDNTNPETIQEDTVNRVDPAEKWREKLSSKAQPDVAKCADGIDKQPNEQPNDHQQQSPIESTCPTAATNLPLPGTT